MTADSAHAGQDRRARTRPLKKPPGRPSTALSRAAATPRELIEEAFAALAPYGSRADGLKAVARYLVERRN